MDALTRRAALFVALVASPAAAQSPEPIRVAYSAPEACPGADAFTAQVLARTRLARRADATEQARAFTVTIAAQSTRFAGNLTVDGSRRDVAAATCAEVVGALALVAALTIDPAASTAPLTAAPTPPPDEPKPAPPAPAAAPPAPRPTPAPRRDANPEPRPRAEPAPRVWAGVAVLGGGTTGAVAPRLMPVARLQVAIEYQGAGALAPALAVSAAYGHAVADSAFAEVAFDWLTGRLDACPAVWRPARTLALRPCLALDVGLLRAGPTASTLATAAARSRLWLSGDAFASLEWSTGSVLLRVEGGAIVPLLRDRFVFEDPAGHEAALVHDVPAVSGFAGLGVGVVF